MTEMIAALAEDPAALSRLSEAAAERGASLAWDRSVEPLVQQLMAWFPDRLATRSPAPGLKLVEQTASTTSPERPPTIERPLREPGPRDRDDITEIRQLQIAAAGSVNMSNLRD